MYGPRYFPSLYIVLIKYSIIQVIYSSDIVHSSPNITSYQINTVTACCYGRIEDLAVDWWGNNLYWTDSATGIIWVAKLNGTNKHVLLKGLTSLTHLVLNPYER